MFSYLNKLLRKLMNMNAMNKNLLNVCAAFRLVTNGKLRDMRKLHVSALPACKAFIVNG